ncbi:MAG: glycine zipper 2TM domain-containing protein [Sandarakinorhabdus sp.]|nr:glycine zipper 2TM domain-containing protein [Sandarakinorhabdus sp.]
MLAATVSASAQIPENGPYDRQNASRGEVERSQARLQDEKRDVRDAQRYGNERDVRRERRDVEQARQEYRQDAQDLHASDRRRNEEYREDGRHWNQGRHYGWNRPDPRYNGYYADNYYRSGNYRPTRLGANDRIYRGNDNRYYCRRGDGTTGLIVGAVGGGVLGNVIAPGGSKTLGSILGGSLGAVLGNSIDRNNVTCR